MTRDDIIRMAKEVGIRLMGDGFGKPDRTDVWATQDEFECFAALVYAEGHKDGLDDFETGVLPAAIKAEREACAKVCDKEANLWNEPFGYALADAIRARGQKCN